MAEVITANGAVALTLLHISDKGKAKTQILTNISLHSFPLRAHTLPCTISQ